MLNIAVVRLVRKCKMASHSHISCGNVHDGFKKELVVYDRFKKHAMDNLDKCGSALH